MAAASAAGLGSEGKQRSANGTSVDGAGHGGFLEVSYGGLALLVGHTRVPSVVHRDRGRGFRLSMHPRG